MSDREWRSKLGAEGATRRVPAGSLPHSKEARVVQCAGCETDVAESEGFQSERGLLCASCNLDDELAPSGSGLPTPGIVGLVAGAAPFFAQMRSASTVTVNGRVVESSSLDFIALGGGGVAVACGLLVFATSRGLPDAARRMAIAAACVGLGAFQLLRGLGMLG